MSKAFYPTNDGHIGNLQKLSTREINDLLTRQQELLKKKQSILNKLPDKGERIKSHVEHLKQELRRRELPCSSTNHTAIQANENKGNQDHQNHKTEVETSVRSEDNETSVRSEDNENDMPLEIDLQQLSITSDKEEIVTKIKNEANGKQKHQFEVALERAQKNLQSGLRQPVKLNRGLKIEHVRDLPEEITKMKCTKTDPSDKEHKDHKVGDSRVMEEFSAVPPCYKFTEAKQIDLTESLHLQQQQKQQQEELNAQLAAEKLAETLHIKMEPYNPEGIDMSYRSSKGGQFDDVIDSDDDDNDAENVDRAGYSKSLVPSDTED